MLAEYVYKSLSMQTWKEISIKFEEFFLLHLVVVKS